MASTRRPSTRASRREASSAAKRTTNWLLPASPAIRGRAGAAHTAPAASASATAIVPCARHARLPHAPRSTTPVPAIGGPPGGCRGQSRSVAGATLAVGCGGHFDAEGEGALLVGLHRADADDAARDLLAALVADRQHHA